MDAEAREGRGHSLSHATGSCIECVIHFGGWFVRCARQRVSRVCGASGPCCLCAVARAAITGRRRRCVAARTARDLDPRPATAEPEERRGARSDRIRSMRPHRHTKLIFKTMGVWYPLMYRMMSPPEGYVCQRCSGTLRKARDRPRPHPPTHLAHSRPRPSELRTQYSNWCPPNHGTSLQLTTAATVPGV